MIELLAKLPPVTQRGELARAAETLKARIEAKAFGDEVSKLASGLRWRVIEAYNVAVVPKRAPDLKLGAALYAAQCAGCHGVQGRGDGLASKGLDPAPSNFHDRERMVQRSLYGLYSTITLGVGGTSMIAFSQLSEDERWVLAFYVGTIGNDQARVAKGAAAWQAGRGKNEIGTLRAVATLTDADVESRHGSDVAAAFAWLKANGQAITAGKESPLAFSQRLLAESAEAYRGGRRDDAQRLALTAYLEGFEFVEASLDTIDRNLRQEVETQMIAYRDLMRRGVPADDVTQLARRIDALLEASADKLGGEGLSPTTAAISAFFILLREGLEALLVVGAIIAFLKKARRFEALPWIHAGWIGAIALGVVTWFVAATLIEISGATRELTEGVTALLAAAILLYVGIWLHGKSQAHAWKAFVDQHLKRALAGGTLWALAGVSFLAVYREAFETVLFYQALWQQAGESARGSVLIGFGSAVAVLALLAFMILRYSVRLPIGTFFAASAVLLATLAVIFTGHGIKALQEAGYIAASPFGTVNIGALGVYATIETLLAQAVMLSLVIAAFAWTRVSSKRSAAAT